MKRYLAFAGLTALALVAVLATITINANPGFAPKVLVESKVIGLNQKSGANVVHLILILYASSLGSPSSLR